MMVSLVIFSAAVFSGCGKSDETPAGDDESSIPQTALPDIEPLKSPLTPAPMSQETVNFQTTDGVTIVADWSLPEGAKKAVLLLHMMPAVRDSYAPLSAELNKAGFATLAIDLRGHGGSTAQGGKILNYKKFSDADHQTSRLDVDAAMNFLKTKGFNEGSISFVGASIGANLALDALSRYSNTTHAVLLSPGMDYRGVLTEPAMKNLGAGQKTWIVSSERDTYSADSTLKLQQMQPETSTMTIFGDEDHGTDMFEANASLVTDIVKFLGS